MAALAALQHIAYLRRAAPVNRPVKHAVFRQPVSRHDAAHAGTVPSLTKHGAVD
jgi:hypothetical protein